MSNSRGDKLDLILYSVAAPIVVFLLILSAKDGDWIWFGLGLIVLLICVRNLALAFKRRKSPPLT